MTGSRGFNAKHPIKEKLKVIKKTRGRLRKGVSRHVIYERQKATKLLPVNGQVVMEIDIKIVDKTEIGIENGITRITKTDLVIVIKTVKESSPKITIVLNLIIKKLPGRPVDMTEAVIVVSCL
jgi:hypothetical protein